METNIAYKLKLFKEGKIIEDDNTIIEIEHNEDLLANFNELLHNYYTDELEYYIENYISYDEYLEYINRPVPSSETFPISGEDFNLDDLPFDRDYIEDVLGLDFEQDLKITGDFLDDVDFIIQSVSNAIYVNVEYATQQITGAVVEIQESINSGIELIESKRQEMVDSKYDKGMFELYSLYADFIDNNLMNETYKEKSKIILDIMKLPDISEQLKYNWESINLAKLLKKFKKAIKNKVYYSKVNEKDLEKFNVEKFKDLNTEEIIRMSKAIYKLLPIDSEIVDISKQDDLVTATINLLNEIFIFINILKEKGIEI
jgi:hypothetical protein